MLSTRAENKSGDTGNIFMKISIAIPLIFSLLEQTKKVKPYRY